VAALQSGRVLDRSVDSYAQWLTDAARFAAALGTAAEPDLGEGVSLRVEVQRLIGLETTDAVLFLIDTRFLSLADVALVPAWASRLAAVLAELPQDMADYKGIADLRSHVIAWLRQRLPASA
jgi:dimethylamine monooxygenase subunit A